MDAKLPTPYFPADLRKPAMSVQPLSPNLPYGCWEGGFTDGEMDRIEALGDSVAHDKATLIAFPSYVLHRVTPIICGVRKAVVVWTTGPKFR